MYTSIHASCIYTYAACIYTYAACIYTYAHKFIEICIQEYSHADQYPLTLKSAA